MNYAVWAGLWLLPTVATRSFHPTLAIAAVATACLELASASAVHLNQSLRPVQARGRFAYGAALLAGLLSLAAIAVVVIQLVYDILWWRDPRRF